MDTVALARLSPTGDEARLNAFGLSSEVIHTALRPGVSRASNRTSMALRSTPGTDIYHDGMEQFALLLMDDGWRLVYVDQQPRLLHPEGLISFTLASGSTVAHSDHRKKPRTRRKGQSTRDSLAAPRTEVPALFEIPRIKEEKEHAAAAKSAPLWFLLHERTQHGLKMEFARPSHMTEKGVVDGWEDSIAVPFLDLDGDFSTFEAPDPGDFDVAVEPL
jgi:hypothetical protein